MYNLRWNEDSNIVDFQALNNNGLYNTIKTYLNCTLNISMSGDVPSTLPERIFVVSTTATPTIFLSLPSALTTVERKVRYTAYEGTFGS